MSEVVLAEKQTKSIEDLVWAGEDSASDSGKAYVDCTLDYDDEGRVHIVFPQTVDIGKLRQTANGNVFIALKAPAIELNIVQQVAGGGDPKERVMVTYPVATRLSFKLK